MSDEESGVSESSHAIWESALSTLEGRIKPHNFELWLRPIACSGIEGRRIFLSAPSKWIKEWFQDNYQDIVLEALQSQTHIDFEIAFEVCEIFLSESGFAPRFAASK